MADGTVSATAVLNMSMIVLFNEPVFSLTAPEVT
jgi:hypothetical protein